MWISNRPQMWNNWTTSYLNPHAQRADQLESIFADGGKAEKKKNRRVHDGDEWSSLTSTWTNNITAGSRRSGAGGQVQSEIHTRRWRTRKSLHDGVGLVR